MSSQLTTVKPTVENCDPITHYQSSTPGEFFFQELPVLYGGGRKWNFQSTDSQALKYISLAYKYPIEVDVFVLNTSIIIWLNDYNKGIEITYPAIDAHAVKKDENGKLQLYIQVKNIDIFESTLNQVEDSCEMFTELLLTPIYGVEDRYYNDTIERLFTYEFFGINRGDMMVINTFNAIGKCSALHYVESDIEEESIMGSNPNYYENGYNNSGNADDIGDCVIESEWSSMNAGVDVKICGEVLRGKTRNREDLSFEDSMLQDKSKSPKRIKC